jgi:hypothetical protein
MHKLLADLFADLRQLELRFGDVTHEIEAMAGREDAERGSRRPLVSGRWAQLHSSLPLGA